MAATFQSAELCEKRADRISFFLFLKRKPDLQPDLMHVSLEVRLNEQPAFCSVSLILTCYMICSTLFALLIGGENQTFKNI